MGRAKLPLKEKKVSVIIYVKKKHKGKATKEVKPIEEKYNK